MTFMPKAIRQPNGDLILRAGTEALLYRTVQELGERLAARQEQGDGQDADLLRAVASLHKALGEYAGTLPTVTDLLGDPAQEMLRRNLLKG